MSISWADQQKINEFSKLNARLIQHERAIEALDGEKEVISDASMELELVDEDELLDYRVGDSFVKLPQSEIMELLEKQTQEIEGKIDVRKGELTGVSSRMSELKSELYARFGDAINLERE